MNKFVFNLPTSIRYSWGRVNEVGKVVSRYGKKCLLVTVKSFPAMEPLFNKVKELCNEAGVEVVLFSGKIGGVKTLYNEQVWEP